MEITQLNQRIAVINGESKRLNDQRQVNIGRRDTLEKQINNALAQYQKTYGVAITIDGLDAEIARVSAEKEREVAQLEQAISLIKAGDFDNANKLLGTENTEGNGAVGGAMATDVGGATVADVADTTTESQNVEAQTVVPQAETTAVPQRAIPNITPPAAPQAETQQSAPKVAPSVIETPNVGETVGEAPKVSAPPKLGTPNVAAPPMFDTPSAPPMTGQLGGALNNAPAGNLANPSGTSPSGTKLSGLLDEDMGTPPAPPSPPPVSKPTPKVTGLGVGEPSGTMAKTTSFNAILGGQAFNPNGGAV